MKEKIFGTVLILLVCCASYLSFSKEHNDKLENPHRYVLNDYLITSCAKVDTNVFGSTFEGYYYSQYLNFTSEENYEYSTVIYKTNNCRMLGSEIILSYLQFGKIESLSKITEVKNEFKLISYPLATGITIPSSSEAVKLKNKFDKACNTSFEFDIFKNLTNTKCSAPSLALHDFTVYSAGYSSVFKYNDKAIGLSNPVVFFNLGSNKNSEDLNPDGVFNK